MEAKSAAEVGDELVEPRQLVRQLGNVALSVPQVVEEKEQEVVAVAASGSGETASLTKCFGRCRHCLVFLNSVDEEKIHYQSFGHQLVMKRLKKSQQQFRNQLTALQGGVKSAHSNSVSTEAQPTGKEGNCSNKSSLGKTSRVEEISEGAVVLYRMAKEKTVQQSASACPRILPVGISIPQVGNEPTPLPMEKERAPKPQVVQSGVKAATFTRQLRSRTINLIKEGSMLGKATDDSSGVGSSASSGSASNLGLRRKQSPISLEEERVAEPLKKKTSFNAVSGTRQLRSAKAKMHKTVAKVNDPKNKRK